MSLAYLGLQPIPSFMSPYLRLQNTGLVYKKGQSKFMGKRYPFSYGFPPSGHGITIILPYEADVLLLLQQSALHHVFF